MATAEAAVTRLAVRELWRGILAVVAGVAVMLQVIVSSFSAAFSNGALGNLQSLTDNPAVRALYGAAYDLHDAGGFGVWRGGTFVLVVSGLWAALATVRVLRGEEEVGRWDLLLSEPLDAGLAVGCHLLVLFGGCAAVGIAVAAVFLGAGQAIDGSLLYGAGVALLAAGCVGIGACAAQLFGQRRRAAGFASGAIGLAYVVRMLADATDSLGWLRWLTPFGWVEELRAFAGDRWIPLAPLLVLPALLLVAARWMYRHRDLGSGLLPDTDRVVARPRLLGSLTAFAWRERLGGVAGWGSGLAVYGLIIGAITASFTDFIAKNADFQKFAATYGIVDLTTPADFVGLMAGVVGLLLVLKVATALHRGWEDENEGRLELLHALPVTRSGWLGAEVVTSLVAVGLTGAVSAFALWVGAVAGGADLGLGQSFAAVANTASVVVLFAGLAVALHGLLPRAALAATAGLAVTTYFLSFLGPAADLPDWLVALSPFHHLAQVPAVAVAWTATLVTVGAAIVLGIVGFAAYARRDLV